MSLSDSATDAVTDLCKELAWYSYEGYSPKSLQPLFEALHQLSIFIAPGIAPPNFPKESVIKIADRMVVANILAHADDKNEDEICQMLAGATQASQSLAESIDRIHRGFNSDDAIFDILKEPDLARRINLIKAKISTINQK